MQGSASATAAMQVSAADATAKADSHKNTNLGIQKETNIKEIRVSPIWTNC
jgi:hypothetical protein